MDIAYQVVGDGPIDVLLLGCTPARWSAGGVDLGHRRARRRAGGGRAGAARSPFVPTAVLVLPVGLIVWLAVGKWFSLTAAALLVPIGFALLAPGLGPAPIFVLVPLAVVGRQARLWTTCTPARGPASSRRAWWSR